ncbi:MAG: hypothetical protein HY909_22710 [Deltaproteobacteria bacterium]|nr:hypothetical protein [Deltaproteobacteria bacterium]
MSTFGDRLKDDYATIAQLGELLDGMTHEGRLTETRSLGRGLQRRLYQKAASGPVMTLGELVPEGVPARREVRHHGKNTLPVPGPYSRFEKRLARPEAGGERLFGYNEGASRWFLGPGYFVAVPTAGNKDWVNRGGVVVDYFQVPDGAVPDSWPKVVPNTQGLQRFVFHHTRDFLRRVSKHVSIGIAYKEEKCLDHFFTLVRED